jgi:hypothetical protein
MDCFSGTFQVTGGRAPLEGACILSFDDESLQVVAGGQPALACDLGDIDTFAAGNHVLDLTLYTGQRLHLQQFGKAFDTMANTLLDAHRARVVQCLLLEDLEEVSRYTAAVRPGDGSAPSEAQVRIYKSNLAFLPVKAPAFQLRLADVQAVEFDAATYAVTIRTSCAAVTITKLAKRTEEFRERLQAAIDDLERRSIAVLRAAVPFLPPDALVDLATLLREGHSRSLAALDRIDSRISPAIVSNVVDARLRPCYDALSMLSGKEGTFTGFKIIRPEAEDEAAEAGDGGDAGDEAEADQPSSEAEHGAGRPTSQDHPVLHWFFFRLVPPASTEPMLAWESTSRGGRATYVFREAVLSRSGAASPEQAVDALSAGLALVNFRREPIYLPGASLETQPRFHRYAIAARRLPELRALRAAFVGRAIHASADAWRRQLAALLGSPS